MRKFINTKSWTVKNLEGVGEVEYWTPKVHSDCWLLSKKSIEYHFSNQPSLLKNVNSLSASLVLARHFRLKIRKAQQYPYDDPAAFRGAVGRGGELFGCILIQINAFWNFWTYTPEN